MPRLRARKEWKCFAVLFPARRGQGIASWNLVGLRAVLPCARVVEFGSHDELVANGGQCVEFFAIQAAAYQ